MSRPTQAIVNLAALKANYMLACDLAPNSQTLAVVKANAYGHGAVEVAKALEPLAPALAVACIEEAIELREAGIKKPILLLEGTFTYGEVQIAAENDFWLVVENHKQLQFIEDSLEKGVINKPLKVWLGVDSGMHRLGFMPLDFRNAYQKLMAMDLVQKPLVLTTHFASADDESNKFTLEQISNFKAATADLEGDTSLANSAGVLAWPVAHGSWNRPGFMLYGASPFEEPQENGDQLQAVMTLVSKVISVRDIAPGETVGYSQSWKAERQSRIATITVGYGDGYPRHAKPGTPVLVNGQRAKLVGRVSMDMITVDVTDIDPVRVGDDVELWGDNLPINEIAQWADTIGYELMTRMPMRASRVYING